MSLDGWSTREIPAQWHSATRTDTRWTALHMTRKGSGVRVPHGPPEALVRPTFAIAPLSDSARVITK